MRDVELAGARSFLAPSLDEFSIFGKFHHAVVASVAVADEDVAVGRNGNVGGSIEGGFALAGHARGAERHHDFAFRREFENLLALAISRGRVAGPNESALVDGKAVGLDEHAVAEAAHQFSGLVKD